MGVAWEVGDGFPPLKNVLKCVPNKNILVYVIFLEKLLVMVLDI